MVCIQVDVVAWSLLLHVTDLSHLTKYQERCMQVIGSFEEEGNGMEVTLCHQNGTISTSSEDTYWTAEQDYAKWPSAMNVGLPRMERLHRRLYSTCSRAYSTVQQLCHHVWSPRPLGRKYRSKVTYLEFGSWASAELLHWEQLQLLKNGGRNRRQTNEAMVEFLSACSLRSESVGAKNGSEKRRLGPSGSRDWELALLSATSLDELFYFAFRMFGQAAERLNCRSSLSTCEVWKV